MGPVTADGAREAWQLVFELFMHGGVQQHLHHVCSELGMNPGHVKVLLTLTTGTGVPMRDLAERFGCDASWVTALIDGLEERGLAERRPHPSDRRVKTVVLTPAGLRMQRKMTERLYDPPVAFDALSPADARSLAALMRKVVAGDPTLAADGAGLATG